MSPGVGIGKSPIFSKKRITSPYIPVPTTTELVTTTGVSYDPDLLTYISGLVTPISAGQLGKINTFVSDYKTHDSLTNLSDKYDVMYYLGNETVESSLRNLVKRAHDATAVNGIEATHVPYEGFTGDGISMYIDPNYSPATEADNYALDSASFGIYYRATSIVVATMLNGVWDSSGTAHRIQLYYAGGGINAGNDASAGSTAITPPAGGFKIVTRNEAAKCEHYLNKTQEQFTRTSTQIPDQGIFLSALRRVAGTPLYFDRAQLSFAFAGAGLTQTSVNYITDDFEALMDSNGKGVI